MDQNNLLRFAHWSTRVFGAIAIIIGSFWFIAWMSGWANQMTDIITVKTNMSLCLILAGVALFMTGPDRAYRIIGIVLAAIVFSIGALTLFENLSGIDLGIDQLLAKETYSAIATFKPNRFGLPGSLSLTILGSGLLLLLWGHRTLSFYLGLVVCTLNLVPALGYFLKIDLFYREPRLSGIAWPTIVALICLGFGLVMTPRDNQKNDIFLGDNPGGFLLRRLLPAILLIPLGLVFVIRGEHSGLYDSITGIGILVLVMVVLLILMAVFTARALNRDYDARILAEKALRESEKKYKELVSNARSIILKQDTKGRFTFFNEYAQHLFGYSEEEILGKTAGETIVPKVESTGRELESVIENIYEDPDKYNLNINENIKKNGERVWIEYHNKTLFDDDGKKAGHIAIGVDITERKKSEDSLKAAQEKLRLALENGNIGLWEWDLETDEVIWDERMEKMFGLKSGSFGKSYKAFEELVYEEDLSHIRRAIKHARENVLPFETVFRIRNENTGIKYLSSKALINKDMNGKPVSFTGVCFDVTGLREGTEKIIIKLNEELLRSNKELENFAYVASHDLQEPLRTVASFTQLLSKKYKDKLDDNAKEYIDFAVDGSKRMHELLNGLLDYSRVNTKGISFEPVNMNDILESVKKNLSLVIKERNVTLEADSLPVICADKNQMIQLFQNIISNGIKFSTTSPRIYISSEVQNSHYLFSIRDEGMGIEPQYFEKIFLIFQRLMPKDQYEGTGIGLAICKRIVERHGGVIWVESEPGKGSVFYFTLKAG